MPSGVQQPKKADGTFLEKHNDKLQWHMGTWISIIIGIVVIAAVGVALYNHQVESSYTLPALPSIGGNLPPTIAAAASSNATLLNNLAGLSANTITVSQFHANYTGKLSVSPSGYLSFVPGFSSPLSLIDERYNGSIKMILNASSVPVMGSADIRYEHHVGLTTSVCANFNQSAANSGDVEALLTGNHVLNCQVGHEIAGINLAELANFNFTQMQNMGYVFKVNKTYQTSVNGQTCSLIMGDLFQQAANGTVTGSGTYEFCISNQYYVPVVMAFTINNKNGAFFAILNATSIGNSASQQFVTTLP